MTRTVGELMDEEAKACVDRLKARVVELESALAVTSGYVAVERERDQVTARLKGLHEMIERAEKAYCINGDHSGETLPIIAALARMASSADTLKDTVRRQNNEIFRMEDKLKEERANHGAEVFVLRRQLEDLKAKPDAVVVELEQKLREAIARAELAEQQEVRMRRRVDESELREAELRAKCSAPKEAVSYLRMRCAETDGGGGVYRAVRDLLMWAEDLDEATRPKRQTRAESVADQITKIREASKNGLGVLDAMDEARMICHAAGVNADEEKPEAT